MKRIFSMMLSFAIAMTAFAANTITQVEQVSESVTISDNVDYVITGTTPFTAAGSVNITNTDHAVVIIQFIRPSLVIKNWLKTHVFINGEQAVNGTNCQVKMYASGAIIMPYAKDIKPLTVYSEQSYKGTAVNDFGLEHSGGFMNTLTDAKLNNKIRSFKLKRGYMVTFSTRAQGRGYSRCFIADTEDLEVPSLPAVLDGTISSYRVFQWLDAQKKGVHDTSSDANAALGTTWAFDWGQGNGALLPDVDWTSHHIYEDWPSAAACGSVTQTCHMQTNNEPGNSADDHPQDVATVLANWENLMRTGMRLCSESSHDGSMGHLKAFMDSIDARGWRCDILDLHCYWDSGTFNNLTWYSDNYGNGRPIWISEWVWGASWNHNGAFASGRQNDNATYDGTVPILEILNKHPRVERYAYWNSEADYTKIWRGGKLTKLGEYYAKMQTGIGYNKKYEYIPKNPRQYTPSKMKAQFDKDTKKVKLTWHDENGEYNQSMIVQVKKPGGTWLRLTDVDIKELPADYTLEVDGLDGYSYRVQVKDVNGDTRTTGDVMAVNNDLEIGGAVTMADGSTKYLGGNLIENGDFENGAEGWKNGAGNDLTAPYFQIVPVGGSDGGAYLQCYGGNTSRTNQQSIYSSRTLEPGAYYAAASVCNAPATSGPYMGVSSNEISVMAASRLTLSGGTAWERKMQTFTATETNKYFNIILLGLKGTSQFDDFMLAKLFDTPEEALADALVAAKKKVELFKKHNTEYAALNDELDALVAGGADAKQLEDALKAARKAKDDHGRMAEMAAMLPQAEMYSSPALTSMKAAMEKYEGAKLATEVTAAVDAMGDAVDNAFKYSYNTSAITNPEFKAATGWKTKTGTYTGGDQRLNTGFAGKDYCWNAWWSLSVSGNEDKTMGVEQDIPATKALPHGLYALEVKATTQHYCENDQHGYMKINGQTLETEKLPYGLADLPSFSPDQKWQTLSTPFVYAVDSAAVTIGFIGSKKGATDKQYIAYANPSNTGDNREGWWCATDFQLRFIPMYRKAADANNGWGTIALQYRFTVSDDVELWTMAGMTEDGSRVLLEKVEGNSGEAAKPYVFRAKPGTFVNFYEDNSLKPATGQPNTNGMTGVSVKTSLSYGAGSYIMKGGEWQPVVTSTNKRERYSAFITGSKDSSGKPYIKFMPWNSENAAKYLAMPVKGFLIGDANGDGQISKADADLVVNYFLGGAVEGFNASLADVNNDGAITIADANAIVNIILGSK